MHHALFPTHVFITLFVSSTPLAARYPLHSRRSPLHCTYRSTRLLVHPFSPLSSHPISPRPQFFSDLTSVFFLPALIPRLSLSVIRDSSKTQCCTQVVSPHVSLCDIDLGFGLASFGSVPSSHAYEEDQRVHTSNRSLCPSLKSMKLPFLYDGKLQNIRDLY